MITKKFHESKAKIAGMLTEGVAKVSSFEPIYEFAEAKGDGEKKEKLRVTMEAIHVGKTRNGTFYTEKGLKEGIDSWTKPHEKPVLTHHNSRNGEPIGRIKSAKFEEATLSGRKGLVFEVEISDKEAIEKVKDGRYSTVSIGGYTDSVVCSCCGTDRMDEWCEHYPGEVYDGQECHFIIGTTFGEEVSYVNTPADIHAGNIAMTSVTESTDGADEPIVQTQRPEGVAGIAASALDGVDEGDLQGENPENGSTNESTEDKPEGAEDGAGVDGAQAPVVEEGKDSPKEDPETAATVEESNGETSPSSEPQAAQAEPDVDPAPVLETVQLKADNALLREENTNLLSQIAVLEAQVKEGIAKEVIELKKKLGRSDVDGVEESVLVEGLTKRSIDSLKDAREDLLKEANREHRSTKVDNPALGGAVVEGKDASKEEEPVKPKTSAIALVKNMIGGMSGHK
ncbi:hypothetical protein C0431_13190 [bacterium]|nr:hypothetical protein [bacterium]